MKHIINNKRQFLKNVIQPYNDSIKYIESFLKTSTINLDKFIIQLGEYDCKHDIISVYLFGTGPCYFHQNDDFEKYSMSYDDEDSCFIEISCPLWSEILNIYCNFDGDNEHLIQYTNVDFSEKENLNLLIDFSRKIERKKDELPIVIS